MTTEEVRKLYTEELDKINEQMVTATSPEWGRLVNQAKDAAVVIEKLGEVLDGEADEPRLKVYQITMFEQQEFGAGDLIKDIIVALGSDEYTVCKYVFGNLGYDIMKEVRDETFRIVEVEGPFGQGSLLYRHKVIND